MTEAEWRSSNDALAMMEYLKGKAVATARKLFLFKCAGLRRLHADQPLLLELIETAERFLENGATIEERRAALARLAAAYDPHSLKIMGVRHCLTESLEVSHAAYDWYYYAMATVATFPAEHGAAATLPGLVREIFPTPLIRRVPRIPASWRNPEGTVFRLAQAAYEDHAFDRLPILADALEEAGCTNADILNHCRQPGDHVRGCWVVDLLLDKK